MSRCADIGSLCADISSLYACGDVQAFWWHTCSAVAARTAAPACAHHDCAVCCRGWAREGSSDLVWQKFIAEWFRDNGVTSSFYWVRSSVVG